MAQNVCPKPKQEQQQEIPMISANEARQVTNSAQFNKSGYAALMNSTIREVAAKGESEAKMLIPVQVAEQSARFLEQHGFRVTAQMAMTGMVITAAW